MVVLFAGLFFFFYERIDAKVKIFKLLSVIKS